MIFWLMVSHCLAPPSLVFFSLVVMQCHREEASSWQGFFPFAVMHVCFVTICLYLQGFNFVCCYACFLPN
ncbi:hypothetical protein GLYMA_16G079150v4 [Glycine max]|nr:hypothetical protein GLYMA_16G079150v4 [Glycine max]